MAVFVAFPPLALLPAALFWVCSIGRVKESGPRLGAAVMGLTAALAWFAYCVYELGMMVWSESVVAPIRLDLAVVALPLYGISAVAVLALGATATKDPDWPKV